MMNYLHFQWAGSQTHRLMNSAHPAFGNLKDTATSRWRLPDVSIAEISTSMSHIIQNIVY